MGISIEAAKSLLGRKMHEIENEIRELSDWSNEQWLRGKKSRNRSIKRFICA